MKQVAFKMKLKEGCFAEYKKRHSEIWPELCELLSSAGIVNYSIFFDPETNILFGYHELTGTGGAQDQGAVPIVQKWWKYMADIMDTNPDNSPVSLPLEEAFYLK